MRRTTWIAAALFLILVDARCFAQEMRWDGPRQTPAELAAVLRDCSACQTNAANLPAPLPEDGPLVASTGSRPGAGSWLPATAFYGTCLRCGHGLYSRQYSSTILTRGVSRSYSRGRR